MDEVSRPTVGIFTMGGTIAMTQDTGAGVVPRLTARDLAGAVPGLAATGIRMALHDVRQLPSASIGFGDVLALHQAIQAELSCGAITAAVVTQGTDTIEETSWLLDLVHDQPAALVVTGAMRNPALAGADGPANLLAAVQVAASPDARDLGVLVVVNDEIHAARTVRKAHTLSVGTFSSPETGPLGRLTEGTVTLWNRPTRAGLTEVPPTPLDAESPHRRDDERPAPHRTTPGRTAPSAPRVLVLPMTLGQDDAILRAVASQLDGLVIAGFGAGHTPEQLVPVLAELAARIPVILGTRAGAGPVAGRTYGYPGSETDLLARGLISAGYLDPYKARILLQVLLHRGATMEQIRAVVARLGAAPLG